MKHVRRASFGLALAIIAVLLATHSRPATATIETLHQVVDVDIYVNVGVTPAPTAVPSSEAGASAQADVNVGPMVTPSPYFIPSTAALVFTGNPGDTITQTCGLQLSFPVTAVGVMENGLDNNFVALGGTATIPSTAFEYQIPPQPVYTPPINYAADGKVYAGLESVPKSGSPQCINVQFTIPSNATPGTYYAVWALLYYTGI